jgi:phosphoglucosamine mutase
MNTKDMKSLIDEVNNIIGDRGRCIIRPSGTEDYLRVMLEGEDEDFLRNLLREIRKRVEEIDNAYF